MLLVGEHLLGGFVHHADDAVRDGVAALGVPHVDGAVGVVWLHGLDMAVRETEVGHVVVVDHGEVLVGAFRTTGGAPEVRVITTVGFTEPDEGGSGLEIGGFGPVARAPVRDREAGVAVVGELGDVGRAVGGVGAVDVARDAVEIASLIGGGTDIGVLRAEVGLLVADIRIDPLEPVAVPAGGVIGVADGEAHPLAVVAFIHVEGESQLFHLGRAADGLGFFTGLGEGRQQHGGEDGDDGDDHQQFDQGEHGEFFHLLFFSFLFVTLGQEHTHEN